MRFCRGVVHPEGKIDQEDIKAEKAENRPCSQRQEEKAGQKTAPADRGHDNEKASAAKRPVRHQKGTENFLLIVRSSVNWVHCLAHDA